MAFGSRSIWTLATYTALSFLGIGTEHSFHQCSVFRTQFIYRARQIEPGYLRKKAANADHYLSYKWGLTELDWILGLDKEVFTLVELESLFPGYQRLFIWRHVRFRSSLYSGCSREFVVRGFGLRPKKNRPMANTEKSRCTQKKKKKTWITQGRISFVRSGTH